MTSEGSATLVKSSTGKRRLKQALEYVARHWFPLNRKVFEKIQNNLNSDAYGGSCEALIADLKSDFALFTYCLKKIKDLGLQDENPMQALRNTSYDDLKKILLAPGHEISKHTVSSAEKGQALRLKYTVLSCSTAHLLAEAKNTDSDLAYTCAVVRQLGYNLIAWNYPSIYARAMAMVKAGTASFDEALADSLGFTPTELADHVVLGSKVHPLIRKASGIVTYDREDQGDEFPAFCGSTPDVVDICEISEAFAQLNDPEHFPHISRTYETVINQIDQHLGQGGANLVMNTVNTKFSTYVSSFPEAFRSDGALESTLAKVSSEYTSKLFERNTYAQRCPDQIKNRLREVYGHVTRGSISSMGVGLLVNAVIPAAGFSTGCVFLLDNKRMVLVPRLRIGSAPLSRYKEIGATTAGSDSAIVMEALYASTPIKQEDVFLFGDLVSTLLGPLGSKEPLGVLYMEMSERLKAKDSQEVLNLFRAIRHCFNDCLNI